MSFFSFPQTILLNRKFDFPHLCFPIIEDTTTDGDPHFLVTSHTTGDHLCFDAHGYNNEVWNLVKDEHIGI